MNDTPLPALWPDDARPVAADITIVGLGPGPIGALSLEAWQILADAPRILLRTARHPCVPALPQPRVTSACDDLYEAHAEFSDVYAAVVERVLQQGALPGGVVYAVPGHPWVGETTTLRILEAAAAQGLSTRIVGGQSFVAPSFAAVGVDLMDGAQVVDAMLVAHDHHPRVEVRLPLLIAQVYASWLASDLKLTLLNAYPAEHPAWVVHAAGTDAQAVVKMELHALDAYAHFDHLTSVYLPPQADGRSFSDLQEIVAHLRAPEGCPWDREQTLASLRQELLGECAEVVEAIDLEQDGDDNTAHIVEELGDLYLTATMMVQIATEEGRFLLGDAMENVVAKLIRRHPHVFGTTAVGGVEDVLGNWDAIKRQEKAERGITSHALDGVPAALPALAKARAMQARAHKAGLLDKTVLAQANPALAAALGELDERTLGEALWQTVAIARAQGLDAEDALRAYVVAYRASNS
jgi:tetrapyrrole methylase family protein/MazG family protein